MSEAQGGMSSTSRAVQTARERRCEHCGSPLLGKHSQLYCDATCRAMAFRMRQKERMRSILTNLKATVAEFEELVDRD